MCVCLTPGAIRDRDEGNSAKQVDPSYHGLRSFPSPRSISGVPWDLKLGLGGRKSPNFSRGINMLQINRRRKIRSKKSHGRGVKTQRMPFDGRWHRSAFKALEKARDAQYRAGPAKRYRTYQSAINSALSVATSLPLVGHELTGLQDLNSLLQNSLQSIIDNTNNIGNGEVQLAIPLGSISHTFTFDLGLDAFIQLSTSGGVAASITPTLNLAFNNQNGNVTLDTANTNLDIGFSLSLPNFTAKGSLHGILFAQAVDQGTNFSGDLKFGFDADGTVTPEFSGNAQIRLGLSLSFVDPSSNASFNPTFVTQLVMDWGFNSQSNQLAAPTIELKNFGLDADSFMHGFLGDIVTTVQKYTEPLEPFINTLDTPGADP